MILKYQYKKCDSCNTKNSIEAQYCINCNAPLTYTPAKTVNRTYIIVLFCFLLATCVSFVYKTDYFDFMNTNKILIKSNDKPDWGTYLKDLERNIKHNWHPPKLSSSKRVVAYFVIDRKGNLVKMKIKESSGDKMIDDSARRAILKTKFAPLPKEFKGKNIPIEFVFDYNVLSKQY